MKSVEYDGAFTFKYSPRERTKAWSMEDSVSEETKLARLNEIIDVQRAISYRMNQRAVNTAVNVLVEGESKKSDKEYCGRTDTNKMVVFPRNGFVPGTYASIRIQRANAATLFGIHEEHTHERGSA
jgi:tRNA-2-methylthio-N6-dimethylallyladenosine synthase